VDCVSIYDAIVLRWLHYTLRRFRHSMKKKSKELIMSRVSGPEVLIEIITEFLKSQEKAAVYNIYFMSMQTYLLLEN